ncbi:hypothetical protein AX16_005227 [Volvariella volvacea WC 439]|nr:hypothetical protein AX16_005227 [Volvariella volvacea WC 439]
MSEYWVSKKKYFCKYCEIYIADDPPSRQQHENGLRHKGNLERFIRGIYKAGEKRKKDQEEERREMARVELAAQAAYAHDVSSGNAKPSSASPSFRQAAGVSSSKEKQKPSNPFANYTTAANLGITDPDAQRLGVEAEQRRTQGIVGEWQVIAPAVPQSQASERTPSLVEGQRVSESLKRPVDDEGDTRAFKLRKRTIAVGLGEIYDPSDIPIKIKKSEETAEQPSSSGPSQDVGSRAKPGWAKVEWKQAADEERATDGRRQDVIKIEDDSYSQNIAASTKPDPDIKNEEVAAAIMSGLTIKKRKIPAGQGRRQM